MDEVDNMEALPNNYLASSVEFEYRDGNYNDLIKRFINEVKDKIGLEDKDKRQVLKTFGIYEVCLKK